MTLYKLRLIIEVVWIMNYGNMIILTILVIKKKINVILCAPILSLYDDIQNHHLLVLDANLARGFLIPSLVPCITYGIYLPFKS